MSTSVVKPGSQTVFTRPSDFPDTYYSMWDTLLEGLQRESLGVPMPTLTSLLCERVATAYVRLRIEEEQLQGKDMDLAAEKMWLRLASEMKSLILASQGKPEQRFMSGIKAAITGAVRKVGQDATVRELMPVLVEELRAYDV